MGGDPKKVMATRWDMGWFVWEKGFDGLTTVRHIPRPDEATVADGGAHRPAGAGCATVLQTIERIPPPVRQPANVEPGHPEPPASNQ